MTQTHAYDIFETIVNKDLLTKYLLMNLEDLDDVPEILTMQIPIEGRAFGLSGRLALPWVNVQPGLGRKKHRDDPIVVADGNKIIGNIVGSAISLSYNGDDDWLSPKLVGGLASIFASALTLKISSVYNLRVEFGEIATIVAYYFCNKCSYDIRYIMKCMQTLVGPFPQRTVKEVIDRLHGDDIELETIEDLASAIIELGPARLHTLDANALYRMIGASTSMVTELYFSADYPPMFANIVLRHAYEKVFLIGNVLSKRLISNREINVILDELVKHPSIYKSLEAV